LVKKVCAQKWPSESFSMAPCFVKIIPSCCGINHGWNDYKGHRNLFLDLWLSWMSSNRKWKLISVCSAVVWRECLLRWKNPVMTFPLKKRINTELFIVRIRDALYIGETRIRVVTDEGDQWGAQMISLYQKVWEWKIRCQLILKWV